MENSSILIAIEKTLSNVGDFLRNSIYKISAENIETKGLNDFVSYVDKQAEQMLINDLIKIIPTSGFIAEESGEFKKDNEWLWIIDPLDGTTNYIHGIPLYSISVGLMKNNILYAGFIFEPNMNELFHAFKGEGAFLNNNKIEVSSINKMQDSLWATGFPYYDFDKINQYMDFIKYSIKNTHGLRRLGSAALDLAYTACGRIDGFFEFGLKPWDVAAGTIIVQEANGIVTDFEMKDNFIFNKEIIACGKKLYTDFYDNFRKIYI